MYAKYTTIEELNAALAVVNAEFDSNIRFKRIQAQGRRILFTLTVNDSRRPGGRIGHSGRRVAAACWHVHGKFFDALLEINSTAVIDTSIRGGKAQIYKTAAGDVANNWQDFNIGSQFEPMYYSEACECGR